MKKTKIFTGVGLLAIASIVLVAADHIDAPAVSGGTSDITDFYAFEGQNTNNTVFVANVQGLLSPSLTGAASYDENILIEFNIDNDNDNVEDLVIQAIPRDGKMYFFGPVAPSTTGLNSTIMSSSVKNAVEITAYGSDANISTSEGMSFFAGPRDDPFFMDFTQFQAIIAGNATGFNDPGSDTFKGTNVMSIVAEIPNSMLGTPASGKLNVWVESKKKQ